MTQPIVIAATSLSGPYAISIDGKQLTEVEDFELYREDGVMKLKLVLLTNNFVLKSDELAK